MTALNKEQKILADILSDYRHHILVRACAGSGKTRLLASKYLSTLLIKGNPKGIAAITFTEKAAQELKTRIQLFLRRIASSSSERELELDEHLPWLELSQGLLRHDHPEAPKFNKAALWRTLKEKSAHLSKAMIGTGVPIGTIHAFAMKTLEAYPLEALGGLLTRFDPSGKRLSSMLEDFSAEGLLNASEKISWASYGQLGRLLEEILELLKRGFPEKGSPLSFDPLSPHARSLQELWPEFLRLASESIQKSREEGYLDYDLLLYWLHQFIRNADAELLAELRARAQYILLDELQDTDPLQMNILSRLADLDSSPPHRVTPSPGRLFMVGDPFQSIYGFRGACPELIFEKRKQLFKEFNLSGNKRSGGRILHFVNTAFQGAVADYQAMESAPLIPRSVDKVLWHPAPASKDSSDFRFEEARHTAALIAELSRKHHWRWRDFAVLLRKMTHGWIYLEELRRLGIPAVLSASDTDILKRSLVVRILYWLGKVLKDPENPNAAGFFSHLESFDASGLKERLAGIRAAMETASTGSLIQALKKEFHLSALAMRGGAEEIQGLQLAENMAWKQEGDIGSFLELLQAKFESRESEDQAGEPDVPWEGDCVRIATIHKVKGLQFPCVIMAGLSDWSLRHEGRKLFWDPVKDRAAVAFQEPMKDQFLGSDRESFKELKDSMKRSQAAENERLLYVALTRPEEMLVIFEPDGSRTRKSPSMPILERAKELAEAVECPCCRGETINGLTGEELSGRKEKTSFVSSFTPSPPHPLTPALIYASEKTLLDENPEPLPSTLYHLPSTPKDEHYLQSLGRVLHGTLERIPWKSKPAQKEIEHALEQSAAMEAAFGRPPAKNLLAEARAIALKFLSSPLWIELASSKLLEREFPVAYLKENSLVVGRIDLIYEQTPETLVIADYKTEAGSAAQFRRQGEHYLAALKGYAERMGYANIRFEVISLKDAKRY